MLTSVLDVIIWIYYYVGFRMLSWWAQVLIGLGLFGAGVLFYTAGPNSFSQAEEWIEAEYRNLSSGKYLMGFRKKFRDRLRAKATSRVFTRHPQLRTHLKVRGSLSAVSLLAAFFVLFPYILMYAFFVVSLLFGIVSLKFPILSSSPPPGIHHVDPHYVNPYLREGVPVEGYWRGGTEGYWSSNPDGVLPNNLNSK